MLEELRSLDFIPEPDDPRILSAADPNLYGHQEGFRAEVTGWQPITPPQAPLTERRARPAKIPATALIVLVIALTSWWGVGNWLGVTEIQYPDSEWAYEESRIRDLQSVHNLDGSGVNVCMVDTGIDLDHDDYNEVQIVFKDFVSGSSTPLDHGLDYHGSMMAGILIADGHLNGAAPGISLSVAAALGERRGMETVGDTTLVAQAIKWCVDERSADIISLSLGGMQNLDDNVSSSVENAVFDALEKGVYVVAAAGNDGGEQDDGLVSSPANVPLVIAVGALQRGGDQWDSSSRDESTTDASGNLRLDPHLKPEISAPGVGIISTAPGTNYFRSSGTSGSTVFVTGTLAMILEEHPRMSRSGGANTDVCIETMKQALMESTASDRESIVHNNVAGYGSLDAISWYDSVNAILESNPCYA